MGLMSVDALKQAMLGKVADAPKNNEDDTNKGISDVRKPPEDRKPGTLDAKWGDRPAEDQTHDPAVHSSAVRREAADTRGQMLERLFDAPKADAKTEQALMGQNFANARQGSPHSPMLQRGRVKMAEADETLTDSVMRVIGHR